MIVLADGRFRVRRLDETNIVIEEYNGATRAPTAKDPNPAWTTRGYFGRLDHVFSYLISRHMVMGDEKEEIESLVEKIEETKRELYIKFDQEGVRKMCVRRFKPLEV